MSPFLRLCLVFVLMLPARALAQASQPDLLLEVRLGQHQLSEGIGAYQQGEDVLLPLGELARLLTIAIRTTPAEGIASGYILDQQRGFRLDAAAATVVRGDQRASIDPLQLRVLADDIYVPARLLAEWLPVDFTLDLASLSLLATPREKLPLQARLERLGKGAVRAGAARADSPAYPRVATAYSLASMPFADQTLGVDLRRERAGRASATSYTAYLTGDLLGVEAALYLNTGRAVPGPAARLTLARHDPDATLLGPLRARTVQAGSVAAPGVPNIALGSVHGNGVFISNRPLGQPQRTDRHSLQGDLPPGWDVELYVNGALVGLQQSRADGRYSFGDQPLMYGPNEFRLVFHGPLGQVRVERQRFLIEQSMLAPGELLYSLSAQRERSAARAEWGLHKQLTASAGLVRLPGRGYAELGLQGYLDNLILSAALARAGDGGRLLQFGARTRVGAVSLNASRSYARAFASDFYRPEVRMRDELRADAVLAALPLSLQARREQLGSGAQNAEVAARLSAYRFGTAVSHSLRWLSLAGRRQADGALQASRRVAGIGISGQLQYTLRPQRALGALALSAERHLDAGYLVSAGITRTFQDPRTRYSVGLNKSLGSFGLGIGGYYAGHGDYGVGLQLFLATGREPRSARWVLDAAPMAASGAASLRVFLDRNRNGVMDGGDAAVPGAGFVVNSGAQLARTDAGGLAWIGRLAPNQHADIGIDAATLEDPQWVAASKGMRIVPRAGKVAQLEFAVVVTGEIDGTAYLSNGTVKRPAGDLEVELVDGAGQVAGVTQTTSDGYYVLAGVAPGQYRLRISPAQLQRLGLRGGEAHRIVMSEHCDFINGKDFIVSAH